MKVQNLMTIKGEAYVCPENYNGYKEADIKDYNMRTSVISTSGSYTRKLWKNPRKDNIRYWENSGFTDET